MTSRLAQSAFEDREGNIWVGTESGLDRFSPSAMRQVPTPFREALYSGFVRAGKPRSLYIVANSGIYRLSGHTPVPERILENGSIGVMCGAHQRLFIGDDFGSHSVDLGPDGKPRSKPTRVGDGIISCAADGAGTFWIGRERIYRLEDNSLVVAKGAAGELQRDVFLKPDGIGGVAVGSSLFSYRRLVGGQLEPMWRRGQNLLGGVRSVVPSRQDLLILGEQGLGLWTGKKYVGLSERTYPFLVGLTGLVQLGDGSTWIIGSKGIVRISTAALEKAFDHPGSPIEARSIGYHEGYSSRENAFETADATVDTSGRLWFATNRGLAWVDPRRLPTNRIAPTVVIEGFEAAGRSWRRSDPEIRLPAGTTRAKFSFTALSLTDAKANRFRYRLTGSDPRWVETGGERQAVFTNLGPGEYRFQVIAANNDGIWNERGDTIAFSIAPYFYQTWWFAALCGLAAVGALFLLYRRRLKAVADRIRTRIEGQMSERERIARELHDTLLQGFQGLMLRFQAVVEQLPIGSRARNSLEEALDRGDDVLLFGRERVHALRQNLLPIDISARLAALLAEVTPPTIAVGVTESGVAKDVHGPVGEEIAAIVTEATSNAIRHGRPHQIDVEVEHSADRLTITIRDDGSGIPADVAAAGGTEGHYGLVGMHERAQHMGGTLEITSSREGGTRVKVTVLARIAYP